LDSDFDAGVGLRLLSHELSLIISVVWYSMLDNGVTQEDFVEYTNIKLEKENAAATIRLNRPDALNALSLELLEGFSHAVSSVEQDESIKALVVRGEGRAFCAGADLMFFDSAHDDLARLNPYIQRLNGCLFQLEELPIPTIAVVHGFALAGGLELALACDLTIVADNARIGDQHANFGLIPGGGSTQRLPRRVGMQRAMELLTTGRWLSGAEAAEWGLALRAVPTEKLDEELEKLLALLRSKSRTGLGWIKRVTQRGKDLSLKDGVALEGSAFVQYFATSSHPWEGIKAFKEKRQPEF
jgi:enoyl-CoA hydratase/carnithine racemase